MQGATVVETDMEEGEMKHGPFVKEKVEAIMREHGFEPEWKPMSQTIFATKDGDRYLQVPLRGGAILAWGPIESHTFALRASLDRNARLWNGDHMRNLGLAVYAWGAAMMVRGKPWPAWTDPDIQRRALRWMASGQTGTSSMCLAKIMLGELIVNVDVPWDSGDFGRCHRLLKAIPEWRARIPLIIDSAPKAWRGLLAAWDDLEILYEAHSWIALNRALDVARWSSR